RGERLSYALAVGQRVHRVAGLHDHRPEAAGVVGEDLARDRRARDQPGDDAVAADGRALLVALPAADEAGERRVEVHATARREVAGDEVDELLQVRVQRAVR